MHVMIFYVLHFYGTEGTDPDMKSYIGNFYTLFFGFFKHIFAVINLFFIKEGSSDSVSLSSEECVSHTAADDKCITLFEEV